MRFSKRHIFLAAASNFSEQLALRIHKKLLIYDNVSLLHFNDAFTVVLITTETNRKLL